MLELTTCDAVTDAPGSQRTGIGDFCGHLYCPFPRCGALHVGDVPVSRMDDLYGASPPMLDTVRIVGHFRVCAVSPRAGDALA